MIRATLLLLLAGCAEPDVQRWECTATLMCEGQTESGHFEVCASREDVEMQVHGWEHVCEAELFVYGCGLWSCGELCHPTGDMCSIDDVDAGAVEP